MWYVLCYRYGAPLLHKRWFKRMAHPRRMLQAKHQVEKRGAWVIVIARFLPGSRTSTMIVSGLMHMPAWKFVLAEGSCLFVSVAMQIGFGMLIAHHVDVTSAAGKVMTIVGLIVALAAAGFVIGRISVHRKSGAPAPRSKVKWLKRFRVPRRGLERTAAVNSGK
jgi:membrane protein DedA with SNARE-associated domain